MIDFKFSKLRYFWIGLLGICLVACQHGEREVSEELMHQKSNISGENRVEIKEVNGQFRFFRDEAPFFIKGVCGREQLEMAKAAGANAVRTYTTEGLDTVLDRAHSLGMVVMAGIWLGREIEGFDYRDQRAVLAQKDSVKAIVEEYRNHPALLCWALGNEPDNSATQRKVLWQALDDLAAMVRQLDPNHPVTTVTWSKGYDEVLRYCSNLDFLSVNVFGNIEEFHRKFPKDIPFLYSEWGVLGPWESKKTYWQAVMEQSIVSKRQFLSSVYTNYIARNEQNCLGSFVFYWGQKQEYTPTWFSLFTEDGAKTTLVDVLSELWNGTPPANRAPLLDSLLIDGKGSSENLELSIHERHTVSVRSSDPENDQLRYVWEIIPDGPFFKYPPGKGKTEIRPEPAPGFRWQNDQPTLHFSPPTATGAYRVLVYAYDPYGNGAYANIPFYLVNKSLTKSLRTY